jgi:uncharacterized lipoprotein YajG
LFKQIKKELMKKLFSVLAIAALAVACNNDGKTTNEVKPDSTAVTPAPESAVVKPDTVSVAKPDSVTAPK